MPPSRIGSSGRSLAIAALLASVVFASLVALVPPARAQSPNYISGNACANGPNPKWQSGDTWIMYGDVTVPVGCTLTIEPGATVKGDSNVHLSIDGTLVAGGVAGTPSVFVDNQTSVIPWAGIQFNSGATGSVTWSSFQRVLVAITAQSSSPAIENNTIVQAGAGVRLDTSNSLVADNSIDGAKIGAYGILVTSSSSQIARNAVNGTNIGIQASVSGSPTITDNTITNVSGALALGIYVTNLASVSITGNTIRGGLGGNGGPGGSGSTAVAILANGTPSVSIARNILSLYRGGRGGAGPSSAVGTGGAGGPGGGAAGIAVGSSSRVIIQGNTVADLAGGHGGDGGSSASLGAGGAGGRGGEAIGIEVFQAPGSASYLTNSVTNVTGGNGGDGGQASGPAFSTGSGGTGGSAYGLFSLQGLNPDLSSNLVQTLRGGRGGNSTVSAGGGAGGLGGEVNGIIALADGSAVIHANTVDSLNAGSGGNGVTTGGAGGNATALLALGDGIPYNATAMSFNQLSSISGGPGGIGGKLSGDGGPAAGVLALHVDATLASNSILSLVGGAGGVAFTITNQASKGGDAAGVSLLFVPSGTSILDRVQSVSRGAVGSGKAPSASYGTGFYMVGNATVTTFASLTNVSLSAAGDFDLYVDNYTEATTLNTPFRSNQVAVESAGNLTVRNFLAVSALWPNNITPVAGATITVTDNSVIVYSRVSSTGSAQWIAVTNRRYVNRPTPVWNTTQVSVSDLAYTFASNPRAVNLTASQTQYFTMNDLTAPTSSANPLPPWENRRAFDIPYVYSDGNGVGVANVTLWYDLNGTGWQQFASQAVTSGGLGTFSFTGPGDGHYQFATTAVDSANNGQTPVPPTANNTWTIVDTVPPASHVLLLPLYHTSFSFSVSWAPGAGVTDIAGYTIQVNTGLGWVDWQTNTAATSATFTASAQGSVAFRALSTDFAGNQESKTGNDSWTIVDTIAPQVVSASPSGNLSSSPSAIVITFSEAMNESATRAAFSISPKVDGTLTWSNGSRTLTLQPAQPFSQGATYTVTVAATATDVAGNALAQPKVIAFSTPAPPQVPGLSFADLWPLLLVLAVALAGIAFFLVRRRGATSPEAVAEPPKAPPPAASPKQEAAIDDVFLLYRRDGVLIKHETRRLRPDIDTDILSGMLTAVQQFVKDSFHGDEGEELNEMTVGQMHILIGRGKWLVLAATLTGGDVASMTAQIEKCVEDMENHNWDRLEDWDGDMEIGKALGPYLKKLIRGEYAAGA